MNTNAPAITLSRRIIIVLVVLFILSLALVNIGNLLTGSQFWNMVVSVILLSIPLALLYGCIGLLILAWRQHQQGQVTPRLATFLYRAPRIAGILITLFVEMFALDTFSEGLPLGQMLLGFLMHSLPAIGMGILIALAWRWPAVGFVAFAAAAVFFLRTVFGYFPQSLPNLLIFSGPMAVIAMLFWVNWKWLKGVK